MRTTLTLDSDVYRAVKSIASERGESLGAVLSALARAALRPDGRIARVNGFPVFDIGPDAPLLTPEMVRDALEDV